MKADALHELLLGGWADEPEEVARKIFRADPSLPMLCCNLEVADTSRCARIAVEVVRRRGPRSSKTFAVCLRGADVYVTRVDDVAPGTLVAEVTRQTEPAWLESMLTGKRALDRTRAMETDGWRV